MHSCASPTQIVLKHIFDHVTGSSQIKTEKWELTKRVVWNYLEISQISFRSLKNFYEYSSGDKYSVDNYCTTFRPVRQVAAPRAKYAVSDCVLFDYY